MTNRGVLVAGATLLAANVLILGGVMRNHAGNPDAVVRLTQRELQSWGNQSEGAEKILNLRLSWQMAPGPDGAPWFDRARLEALGRRDLPPVDDTTRAYRWMQPTRTGYVVLELAGPAWERWSVAQQNRRDSMQAARPPAAQEHHAADRPWLEAEGAGASRLMAVDFGLDPLALRRQYPERSRYLILPATYRAGITPALRDSSGTVTAPARVEGEVTQLLPGTVHVPRPLRDSLLALGAAKHDSTTRFEVTLKVGTKWEAWVE
jgi:hypothetical protein